MNEQAKQEIIRKYFFPVLYSGYGTLFIIGFILLNGVVSVIESYYVKFFVFIVSLSFLLLPYLLEKKKVIIDEQIDNFLEEDIKGLLTKSLNKLGIDDTELVSESVPITGPHLYNLPHGIQVAYKKGHDNIIRFSPMNVTIIHFAQHQLLIYNCIFDFIKGITINESTEEYFYKDVVSVSTKSENLKVTDPTLGQIEIHNAEMFTLNTSGGTSLSILIRDPQLIKRLGGDIPITLTEKAIQSVRKMLREKKS